MSTDIPLRCSCGALRGTIREVAPERGNRVVCYCNDCQAFAHYLGRADEVLNARGGTDVFQLSQAQVEISEGNNHLACMRLTPKGLTRWYAACCNTPIGNTLAKSTFPFIGVIHNCTDHETHGQPRDVALGPVRGHVNGEVGFEDDNGRKLRFFEQVPVLWGAVRLLLGGWLRREGRHSPFFREGRPCVEPIVLSSEENRELYARLR